MTATAIPHRPDRAPARPVPWTRLTWVAWRQQRAALAGAAALLAAIGAYLAYTGWQIHHAYDAYTACVPALMRAQPLNGVIIVGPRDCAAAVRAFFSFYGSGQGSVLKSGLNAQTVPFLLLAVPVLLGAFVGGPALARELESGTFRFAWTQSASRMRQAAARLVPLAVVLTAAAYGLSALFSWYIGPFVQADVTGKYPMQLFGTMGTDFAAWTLFSFALTAFAGVLLRRTVPAMAVSIVVLTVLDFVTMMALRQHYAAPVVVTGNGPDRPWRPGPGQLVHDHQWSARQPGHRPQRVLATAVRGHPERRHAGSAPLAPVVVVRPGQPLVAVPAHRGRLAAGRVDPAHRRDGAADPPPSRVTSADNDQSTGI